MEKQKIRNSENQNFGNQKNWKIGNSENLKLVHPIFFYIFVIGHLECRKFGKSKNGKIWRFGSPKIRKFRNLVNRKFGNSQNRRFGKTEIRQIAKSERKGILKNKRITGMSLSCFLTHTSGFPGLLATFILTRKLLLRKYCKMSLFELVQWSPVIDPSRTLSRQRGYDDLVC